MAMNFDDDDGDVMSEINMTPLVDVMLVLLIIFMITAPVLKHAVNIDLPKASQQPLQIKPQTVALSIQADGTYLLDNVAVDDATLATQLAQLQQQATQAQLQIHGDKAVPYERVARAMAMAQRAGWTNMAFVTDLELAAP
jgi:biopolymer transport protein ExbD